MTTSPICAASTNIENAANFATPTSTGSKLDQWRVNIPTYSIISAANSQALTPTEIERTLALTF
ncbi:MAG: hypothetical protein U9N63_11930 [Pseudomonadota bacterium]|nr:hypothetical protein [Pseudomonadota bacterium]